MTRKLHQATRRSPARGMSERLGTRLTAVKVMSAVLAVYQSARATTHTHNSSPGKCFPYVRRTNDRQTYKPQLTSSSVGLAQAHPNHKHSLVPRLSPVLCAPHSSSGKPGNEAIISFVNACEVCTTVYYWY